MTDDFRTTRELSSKPSDNSGLHQTGPVDVIVGKRLLELRQKNKISRKELAGRLNIPLKHLAAFEAGTRRMSAAYLFDFAKTFNVTMDYFFDGIALPAEEKQPEQTSPEQKFSPQMQAALNVIKNVNSKSLDDILIHNIVTLQNNIKIEQERLNSFEELCNNLEDMLRDVIRARHKSLRPD